MKKELFRNLKGLTIFRSKAFVVLVSVALIVFSAVPCFADDYIDDPNDSNYIFVNSDVNLASSPTFPKPYKISYSYNNGILHIDASYYQPTRGESFYVQFLNLPESRYYVYVSGVYGISTNLTYYDASGPTWRQIKGNLSGQLNVLSGSATTTAINLSFLEFGTDNPTYPSAYGVYDIEIQITTIPEFATTFVPVGGVRVSKLSYFVIPSIKSFFDFGISNAASVGTVIVNNPILLVGVIFVVSFVAVGVFDRLRHK